MMTEKTVRRSMAARHRQALRALEQVSAALKKPTAELTDADMAELRDHSADIVEKINEMNAHRNILQANDKDRT